ncbi:MAG: SGNH/GDSL hydrolase family protein, partial [Clostridia bacterium]|nr:SGNH/GDSL hydrolase family protein [Clostridia bacterium]
ITMGGADITADCLNGEVISIPAVTGELVITAEGDPAFLDGHLSNLPEQVCSGLNLWSVLSRDPLYYSPSQGWGRTTVPAPSVTFEIESGEKIYASSFGRIGENGSEKHDGIRVTFFDGNGVLVSLDPDQVCAEFSANGCLTAPEGAKYVNIPMWGDNDDWEIHLLNREHAYSAWTEDVAPACASEGRDVRCCAVCGNTQSRDTRITGDNGKILVSDPVPEDYYAGKKIVFLGDSVTWGAFLDDRTVNAYPFVLCRELGAVASNKAVSGSCLCTGGHVTVNETLTEANLAGADVVTIMLGVNDFNHAVKNGVWQGSLKYDENATYYDLGDRGSTDTTEFYGALRSWCERISEFKRTPEFENTEFIFLTMPISSLNRSVSKDKDWDQDKVNIFGRTLREYCTAVMEISAEYGIPVFDANTFSGIYYNGPEDSNVEICGGDGVHPSAEGHRLIAESLKEFLLDHYSCEDRAVANGGHIYAGGRCENCRLPQKETLSLRYDDRVDLSG